MTHTTSVAAYICSNYPHPSELSEARLVKMMYLADWRSSIVHGQQISPISWMFNHYGPYTASATESLTIENGFKVKETKNIFGNPKRVYSYVGEDSVTLPAWQKSIVDFVIDSTRSKTWNAFISLVYSTYPITTQDRYSELDLPKLAAQYRGAREGLGWNVPTEISPIDPLDADSNH